MLAGVIPCPLSTVQNLRFRVAARAVKGLRVIFQVDLGSISRGSRNVVRKDEVKVADLHLVAFAQFPVAGNALTVDQRSITAFQIAQNPVGTGLKDFAVIAAADVIGNDNAIGRRAADRRDLARRQPEHVAPFQFVAKNQVDRLVGSRVRRPFGLRHRRDSIQKIQY